MCAFVMHTEILFTLVRALVKRFIESFHAVGHFSTLLRRVLTRWKLFISPFMHLKVSAF